MRTVFLYLIIVFTAINAHAQELNIGLHVNPAFCTPVFDAQTTYDRAIRVSHARIGYNVGANINYTIGNLAIETGANIIGKDIVFNLGQVRKSAILGGSYESIISKSASVEIPLLLSYCIHRHDKKLVYNTYLVAGGSYEMYSFSGSTESSGSGSSVANGAGMNTVAINNLEVAYPEADKQWFNIVAGFKINTVVRVLGLIDYGLTFHMPIRTNGPYLISADVTDFATGRAQTNTYTGNFNPYLGYIDVKLCYYFLNLDNKFNRVRHRMSRNDG